MLLSSRFGRAGLVGPPVAEHGVEDVDAPACECDQRLVVPFSLGSLAVVEGAAGRVGRQCAERGLVEDAFERAVAGERPLQVADLAGLDERGSEPGRGGEVVAAGEAAEAACHGKQFSGEHGPHPWQGGDEGRVRVPAERLGDAGIDGCDLGAGGEAFGGEVFDDRRRGGFGRDGDRLSLRGCERGAGERVKAGGLVLAGAAQMRDDARLAGPADLGGRDVTGQQFLVGFVGRVGDT